MQFAKTKNDKDTVDTVILFGIPNHFRILMCNASMRGQKKSYKHILQLGAN